jgi:hypothetical protein
MSSTKKLRAASPGQSPSEVTRFKQLWRTKFSDEQKAEFLGWFSDSAISLAEIRARIKARHGVALRHDSQLSGDGALRDWCLQEQANAVEADWTAAEEAELERQGLSGEALRSALLDKIKRRAYIRGDHKLGLAAVKQDIAASQFKLDWEKFLKESDAFFASLLKKAEELNATNLSQSDKIAAMRKAAFADVDALQASGKLKIPKA